MDELEALKIMKIIQSTYRAYFKTENEVRDALDVMKVVLADQEYSNIEKATFEFIRTDTKGFPPVPGQLITLAKNICIAELEQRRREQDLLPEPETQGIPMPEEMRKKFNEMLDRMKV